MLVIISLAALLDSDLLQVRVVHTVYHEGMLASDQIYCHGLRSRWTPSSRAPRRESLGLGDTVIRTSFDQFFAF